MQGHSTLIFCDSCGRAIPDQQSKEAIYQLEKVRYRVELCPTCLDKEMAAHNGHRGVPGFRKRAAVVFKVSSLDEVPSAGGVG